ncbi:MAG: wax ester/triacylglycerol synthase family O-acyltransferase [bacterium]
MTRLSGMDTAFFDMETPRAHMHVAATLLLDPSTMPGGPDSARIEERLLLRLAGQRFFSRRILRPPLGDAVWVSDPRFELSAHVNRINLGGNASQRELATVLGRAAGRQLDHHRPPWELWMIEGLAGGLLAAVIKVHHAAVDGVGGAQMLASMFDLEPDCDGNDPCDSSGPPEHGALPSSLRLGRWAVESLLKLPARLADALHSTARESAWPALKAMLDPRERLPPAANQRCRTVLNRTVGPERCVAFARVPLDRLKTAGHAYDATVNDMVLTTCSLALRRYLAHVDRMPNGPLVAVVPVSLDAPSDTPGNHVSIMLIELPVHLDKPLHQLLAVKRNATHAKQAYRNMGGRLLEKWMEVAPHTLVSGAVRSWSTLGLAEWVKPVHSLIISNVAGPAMALYAGGARITAAYPLGPVMDGAGLNLTVMSYQGQLDLGILACPRSISDPWRLALEFVSAANELSTCCATAADEGEVRAP